MQIVSCHPHQKQPDPNESGCFFIALWYNAFGRMLSGSCGLRFSFLQPVFKIYPCINR